MTSASYLYRPQEFLQFFNGLLVDRIVDPPSIPTVFQDARILERLKVKRESGLPGLKRIRQFADALLTLTQAVDDP